VRVYHLENDNWQVGVLPETGASVAYGRVKQGDEWRDVLRVMDEADYDNPSLASSFILVPWSNRIRAGHFTFRGNAYQLEITSDDGTASHGVGRHYPWQVDSTDGSHIRMVFDSAQHENVNFPWAFTAQIEYRVEGADLVMWTWLKNTDSAPFPAGFGHHPYFVREDDTRLEVPCDQYWVLGEDHMPTGAPVPITEELDHRTLQSLQQDRLLNHVFTGCDSGKPIRIQFPGLEIQMTSDPIHRHTIVYTPLSKPFFAVEPVTNTNDGFNLYDQGIEGTGVFVLEPGEEKEGTIRIRRM
jgi:aldose 1-epimerase